MFLEVWSAVGARIYLGWFCKSTLGTCIWVVPAPNVTFLATIRGREIHIHEPRLLRTSKAPPRSLTSMSCTHARCAGFMGSQYRHTWVTVFWWRLESLYFPCEAVPRRPAGDAAARRLRLSGPPCLGKISPMCPWPASVCQGSKEVTAVPTRIVVQACCFCCLRLGRVCLKTLSTQQTPNWIPMSSHSDVLQQQRTSHRKCCISITSAAVVCHDPPVLSPVTSTAPPPPGRMQWRPSVLHGWHAATYFLLAP